MKIRIKIKSVVILFKTTYLWKKSPQVHSTSNVNDTQFTVFSLPDIQAIMYDSQRRINRGDVL